MTFDLRPFVQWIRQEFEPSVRVDARAGSYAGRVGVTDVELYGVSDMACTLYALDLLYPSEPDRAAWAENFHALQDPVTGWLVEKTPTHGRLHNTAFALGAMNLLNILPRHPLRFAADFATREQLTAHLDRLNWKDKVYPHSHDGAGIASIMALVPGLVPSSWFDWYFAYTDALFDPNNGMMGVGKPAGGDTDQIGGTFHYAFNYEYFHRRMPYPERRIDAVLGLQLASGEWLETNSWWMTLDAIYLLSREVARTNHRRAEVDASVRKTLALCLERVNDPAYRARVFGGPAGVHTCCSATSIFAEIQLHLGAQEVITERPLHQILDKRPFI